MSHLRTKINGLIVHVIPDNKMFFSEREKLNRKFKSGNIAGDEMRKLACFLAIEKGRKFSNTVIVKFCGKSMKLTKHEYETYYKPAYLL